MPCPQLPTECGPITTSVTSGSSDGRLNSMRLKPAASRARQVASSAAWAVGAGRMAAFMTSRTARARSKAWRSPAGGSVSPSFRT